MRPVVDGLVKRYSDQHDIRILNTSKLDSKSRALAQNYHVQYVPTFVFVNSDSSFAGSVVGAVPASRLERELAKLT
jgi:thioredoxin-related protein